VTEARPRRVLLVDDDPAVLRTLVRALPEYAPLQAEDGLAARDILSRVDVDVVVCDLGMPRLDGLDLMRWAKEHCPHPRWIVVSGQDTFGAALQALKLGAFDFLSKPVLPIQLQKAVGNATRHQELVAERAQLARGLEENNARLAESLRNLEAAYGALQEQRSMLDQDLRRAERIMRALLPHSLPSIREMQISAGYRPSDAIGGDLYGAAMIDDRHLAVYVADAAGHGVSAALLAVLFYQRLRLLSEGSALPGPAAVLSELNHGVFDECRASGLFVTAIFALIETTTRTVTLASAGHPAALLLRSTGKIERVEKSGPALGLAEDASFGEHRFALGAGDRLLLYTDGLTDSLASGGPDLETLLGIASAQAKDGGSAVDYLLASSERSGVSRDDITLLLLTADGGAPTVAPDRAIAVAAVPAELSLFTGSCEGTAWIALRGHATWVHATALRDACLRVFETGRSPILDLGACEMLDSTMLGTLHELTARAERCPPIRIQNVPDDIRRLFVELAMTRVESCIVEHAEPLPADLTAVRAKGDAGARSLILHVHELLAELSPHNAEQFNPVIEALRGPSPMA
jgi:sigma-B regulation protein RsbU (phosphoserine phosphatase)